VSWIICWAIILFAGVLQAQAQFSLRAASHEPVDGWQMMQVEHCQSRCVVWVSPTPALTASDIEKAQPEVRADGYRVINIVFTDDGVKKMHDLTAAHLKKVIAMVVDDKVVWAPMPTYVVSAKNNALTGSTSQGLTQEEVERIMAILPH
jgi:preprotein translocase subunit SecD